MRFTLCPKRIDADAEGLSPQLQIVFRWVHEYLCKPYPSTTKIVCPSTLSAINSSGIWAVLVEGATKAGDIDACCFEGRDFLLSKTRMDDVEDIYKSVLIVFPDLSHEAGYEEIERAHRRLKTAFVIEGLMLGQFYPSCDTPSIVDPAIKPLRSPLPLLAIRRMVEGDRPFLADDPLWTAAYDRRYEK